MDRIDELQYKNLRKCFRENLMEPILGKNYYNMAMDVYGADEETTKDIKRKFANLETDLKLSMRLNIVLIIAVIGLTIKIIY